MKSLTILTVLAVAVVFVVSFAGTVVSRSPSIAPAREPRSAVADWLELSKEQVGAIQQHDPDFHSDLEFLRRVLDQERDKLAILFEESQTSDDALRVQIEAVIEAHNRLERRVAEHIIAVRDHLTPYQQKRLFDLFAQQIRSCQRQQRWRHGWQASESAGPGDRAGRGSGQGRGGYGHGWGAGETHRSSPETGKQPSPASAPDTSR